MLFLSMKRIELNGESDEHMCRVEASNLSFSEALHQTFAAF